MSGTEIFVPTVLSDFEPGDRAWYLGSRSDSDKFVFGRFVHWVGGFLRFYCDDGRVLDITDSWEENLARNPLIEDFHKVLDLEDLKPGDRLSKRVSNPGKPIVRAYAFVEEVVPGMKLTIRYDDEFLNEPLLRTFIAKSAAQDSLEVQTMGWEME